MFGFDKPEDGSQQRFKARVKEFKKKQIPVLLHHYWWLVHNCIAHPLIGIAPCKNTFDFHDYTSRKINAE
jgi:hypothetical protein